MAAVNVITNPSCDVDTTNWFTTTNTEYGIPNPGAVVSRNTTDTIDGVACAEVVTDDATFNEGVYYYDASVVLPVGVPVPFSFLAKSVSGSNVVFYQIHATPSEISPVGASGWTRYSGTITSTDGTLQPIFFLNDTPPAVSDFLIADLAVMAPATAPSNTSYATLDDFKQYYDDKAMAAAGSKYDALITQILASSSRMVDKHCNRQFNLAVAESTRYFKSDYTDIWNLDLDDFVLTDAFQITTDNSGTGTFDTVWQTTDYELLPLNGLNPDTNEPWPVETIHAVGGNLFPITPFRRYGDVKVNALWGWPAVPEGVKQAVLVLTAQYFKLKDAPMGVAGFSGFQSMIRVKDNPLVEPLICDYAKFPILGGNGSGHATAGLY